MAILDDLRYVGNMSETKADNEITDDKEDGFTKSKAFRSTNDIRIWTLPKSYIDSNADKDLVVAFDEAYKTAVSFDLINPETLEVMTGRLEKRLNITKDPKYPKRWTLESYTFIEVLAGWE